MYSRQVRNTTGQARIPVQIVHWCRGDEELRGLRVSTRVGHRQVSCLRVADIVVLVVERFAVNCLSASSISFSDIATLQTPTVTRSEGGFRFTKQSDASYNLLRKVLFTWIMKLGMIRWKILPWKLSGFPLTDPRPLSPGATPSSG